MINLKILSKYLTKLYCGYFFAVLILIIGVLVLSNIFDSLQKFKNIHISYDVFWKIITYKIPYLLNEILPLINFIAMLFFLKKLASHNEFIVILSSGMNAWRIYIIPIFITFFLGIGFIIIINPIGALGLKQYELIDSKLTNKRIEEPIISRAGILFFESHDNYNRIIQIQSINTTEKKLNNIVILFLDNHNSFEKRIDANYAILNNKHLELHRAKVFIKNSTEEYDNLIIPTELSINNLTERFILPEMISIWKLPILIKQLGKLGLPTINYQIYYYKQLLKPITMMVMVTLASCFLSLNRRDNSQGRMLVSGLFGGFIIYSLLEILLKILAYGGISPILAVLLPSMLVLFISVFIILHFQNT